MLKKYVAALAAVVPALACTAASAQSVADFYRGKNIRMIIGAAAGGGYDIPGRTVANHLARHIPGNPNIVVENMPGAASLIMTNYLYNIAARDGTAMGMPNNNVPLEPRLKFLSRSGGSAQFDLEKMSWIGTPVQEPQLTWTWSAVAKTFADAKEKKIVLGTNGVGADNYTLPFLANKLLGTKFELVTGYPGTNDIFLAVERGEVQGGGTSLFNLMANKADWMKQGKANVILSFGTDRLAELKDVPTAIELATNKEDADLFRFIAMKFNMARPLVLPPGVPAERVKALQDAFDATMKDPAYLAEARKIGLDISPLGGVAIGKLVQEIQATPEPIIERLRGLLAESNKK